MRFIFLIIGFLCFGFDGHSQSDATLSFIRDTVRIPQENKVLNCEYLITTLKNGTTFQLIKAPTNKYYLRIVTSENLYFDKKDVLEIQSDTKSFYAKDITNYALNKNTGYYVVEVFKNYIGTLKEDGITGLVFDKAQTKYSKQDCSQIKQMAKYFYESINPKKK